MPVVLLAIKHKQNFQSESDCIWWFLFKFLLKNSSPFMFEIVC